MSLVETFLLMGVITATAYAEIGRHGSLIASRDGMQRDAMPQAYPIWQRASGLTEGTGRNGEAYPCGRLERPAEYDGAVRTAVMKNSRGERHRKCCGT